MSGADCITRLRTQAPPVDISHAAQIASIEGTFASCNESFHLDSLVHPLKKGLKAVDSYEILPDADIWENAYDLFRFAERPGERPNDVRHSLIEPVTPILTHKHEDGRSQAGLRYPQTYGIRRRPLPCLLSYRD